MSSSQHQQVYINGDFSEPMSAQHNFQNTYDLSDPVNAMSAYARVMHQHTKSQLDQATTSARRRSAGHPVPSLYNPESSGRDSIDSTDS